MCNQSVGLIASVIEKSGIPTVCLSLLREVAEKVRPPRTLFVPFPIGYPLGASDRTPAFDYSDGFGFVRSDRPPSSTALLRVNDLRDLWGSPATMDCGVRLGCAAFPTRLERIPATPCAGCPILYLLFAGAALLSTLSIALFVPSASGATPRANLG